jgi:N-acetyl-gamma-glutamyl-phosphate reductase
VDEEVLKKCVVIDLGADYRLKDVEIYKSWYKSDHGSPQLIADSVYGLSELYRDEIASAKLIANPGCYTTCAILVAHPLLSENLIEKSPIIIDAKSGVSGAGRSEKLDLLYCEVNESIKPYGVTTHRHTPEIEQQLSLSSSKGKNSTGIKVTFTPHLVPMNRGILCSVYGTLKKGVTENEVEQSYKKWYSNEYFIRLLKKGELPQTRWVANSNYCDINFVIDWRTNQVIAFGALDNLIKGASGQAVQNMNIVFGFREGSGLEELSPFPM